MNNNVLFNKLTGRHRSDDIISGGGFELNKDTVQEFQLLQDKTPSNINIQICSSFRSFEKQEQIWNEKATGKRKLYDRNGTLLDFEKLSKEEILSSILTWSAIPGASRHHWGTDFDIFDASVKKQESVNLTIDECNKDFFKMYNWIDTNLQDFKFFRPYILDLGGVSKEPWHLSYTPLAKELYDSYTLDIFIKNLEFSSIELKEFILKDPEKIFKQYVKKISS